ncbi:MAG: nuclear transport factor 2 family protein [Acidobacteria bacterium]|nr:nuclear transport factor 2 family protein [Acidobacteriota bacterium]
MYRLASAILLCAPLVAAAQTAPPPPETTAIVSALNQSADAWNRGDIDAFAASYKNSPDILFMSRTIQHGYAQMLTRYKAAYPTPAAMGKLSFTHLDVQPLDSRFATVTGNFHLQRTRAGGGDADGYFLLVLEHTPAGWKIVRDDTTALPPTAAK